MNPAAARCGRRRPQQMIGPHPVCHDSSAPPPPPTCQHLLLPPFPFHARRWEATTQRGRQRGMRTHQLHRTIVFPAEVSSPAAQVLRGRAANRKKRKKKKREVGRSFGQRNARHSLLKCKLWRCSYMSGSCSIGSSFHFGLFCPLSHVRLRASIRLFARYVASFFCFSSLCLPFLFPSSCAAPLSASGAVVGQERWPNPVLIETRALIELSYSDG